MDIVLWEPPSISWNDGLIIHVDWSPCLVGIKAPLPPIEGSASFQGKDTVIGFFF